jgi:hypothetical protein
MRSGSSSDKLWFATGVNGVSFFAVVHTPHSHLFLKYRVASHWSVRRALALIMLSASHLPSSTVWMFVIDLQYLA